MLSQKLVVALCCLFLAACGPTETNVESGTRDQILHLGNGSEPQTLDPHLLSATPSGNIGRALLEGLLNVHPETLAPQPGLAERWDISSDFKTYTFYLRPEARWSNGDPITADDFVYSWRRILSPALASVYAYQLFHIKNAEAFNRGELDDFSLVGVKAIDSKTLQVELNHPVPFFLSLLTHISTFAVHPATVEAHGAIDQRGTRWTRPGNYVSSGPFVLKEWGVNRIIRVERNPFYWDVEQVKLQEIRFYPIDQFTTEERMFRTGALHITDKLLSTKVPEYRTHSPELIDITPYLGNYYYRFNTTVKPFDDARVRRALSMAIDRDQIVSRVTRGGELPAYSLTPPGTHGYQPPKNFAEHAGHIDHARRLLAEAGYPNGKDFPPVELLYNTSENHRKIAEAIQQMWQQNLGIDVTLVNQDWKVLLSRLDQLDYQIARGGWIGDYLDPNTFLDTMLSGGGNNRTGWSNPEYDQLIAQANQTIDETLRYQLFQQAEHILLEEHPIIPVYIYTQVRLRSPDVKGWYPNLLDRHPYKYVYLEKTE